MWEDSSPPHASELGLETRKELDDCCVYKNSVFWVRANRAWVWEVKETEKPKTFPKVSGLDGWAVEVGRWEGRRGLFTSILKSVKMMTR